MRSWPITILLLPLVLPACAPAGSSLPPLPPPVQSGTYHLGPGDRVRVVVYGDKELSDVYAIGDDGQIALPLAGTIPARGLTAEVLAAAIAKRLSERGMIRDPSVAVEVASYRPIFILGEVARPGQYPYEPDMTVIAAVSLAGGYTYRAVKGYEAVVRTGADGTQNGLTKPQDRLAPGDVITIFDRVF
jgi:polysaccharide export outer membrane protein